MRPFWRFPTLVVLIALTMLGFGLGSASAAHVQTHSVNNVWHGCAYCVVDDHHVHAYTDSSPSGLFRRGQVYKASTPLGGLSGDCNFCVHGHMDWEMLDAECQYDALNASSGPSLSFHRMSHANPC